jgi:hypothetical protein
MGRSTRLGATLISAALIAALAAGTLIGTALARKPSSPSKISIHTRYDNTQTNPFIYSGRVRSEKDGCVPNRTVVLKNDAQPGPQGTDTTNGMGRWRIALPGDLLTGDYYARVTRLTKQRYVCLGAHSRSVPAPTP